jgi:DNA-binding CsgD family transcriptional regulator/GAF domain-containing protein
MLSMAIAQYSALLDELYEGPLEPYPFQAFLKQLRAALGLNYATILMRPPDVADDGLILSSGENLAPTNVDLAEQSAAYTYHYYAIDPLNNPPLNKVILIDDVIPADQLLSNEYYKLCMLPHGIRYTAAVDLLCDNGQRISVRLCRPAEAPAFSVADREFIQLLCSHIRRAVSTSTKLVQLDSERQLYARAISGRDIGIVMLDKTGRIMRTNAAADRLFKDKDGIGRVHDEIHLKQGELNDRLRMLIQDTLAAQQRDETGPVQALAVPRPSRKSDYELVVKTVPVDRYLEQRNTPHLTVFISDPATHVAISARTLITLYHLTPAEATLSILLADGKSLEDIAKASGITLNTARAHLRSVFQKTGVTQQSMLVSLVLKSLAALP